MKGIIGIVAAAVFLSTVSSGLAATAAETKAMCESMSAFSEIIAKNRDKGVTVEEHHLAIIEDPLTPLARSLAHNLIQAAHTLHSHQTPAEFKAWTMSYCMVNFTPSKQ